MKKLVLTVTASLACVAAFAQGKVTFGNDSQHYYVLGQTLSADSALGGGTTNTAGNTSSGTTGAIPVSPLPSGVNLLAALYGGTSSGSLTLQTSFVLTGANYLSAGRQANKAVTLTFAGGSQAFFDVVVMDAAQPFASLAQAQASSALSYFGESGLFTATPGTLTGPSLLPGGPSSSTWANANLVVNAPVPEPSTLALAGLGMAALTIFRRRK